MADPFADKPPEKKAEKKPAGPDLQALGSLKGHRGYAELCRWLDSEANRYMARLFMEDLDNREHSSGKWIGWVTCSQALQREVDQAAAVVAGRKK